MVASKFYTIENKCRFCYIMWMSKKIHTIHH